MSDAPDRFETIAWVYNRSELALLLSLLEDRDIWVVQVGGNHVALDWALAVALGGVELRVRAEDAGEARMLLAGLDRTPYAGPVFVESRLLDIVLMLSLLLVFWVPPPARIPAVFVLESRAGGGRPTTP